MKKVRAMSVRPCALPWLIGALALALATGGKASAATRLLSNDWSFTTYGTGPGSVDAMGTVTLADADATQGLIPAHHPVLTGTVQNVDAGLIFILVALFDSGGNLLTYVDSEWSPFGGQDVFPFAYDAREWPQGTTSDFTLDVNAILAQHFPTLDLSTAASAFVFRRALDGTARFSNLCLTDRSAPNVAPSLTSPGDQSANEGASTAFSLGSLTDADGDGPWSVIVDWGDNSPTTTFSATSTGSLGTQTHTYADNGRYTVTVSATDSPQSGTPVQGSANFTVDVA